MSSSSHRSCPLKRLRNIVVYCYLWPSRAALAAYPALHTIHGGPRSVLSGVAFQISRGQVPGRYCTWPSFPADLPWLGLVLRGELRDCIRQSHLKELKLLPLSQHTGRLCCSSLARALVRAIPFHLTSLPAFGFPGANQVLISLFPGSIRLPL